MKNTGKNLSLIFKLLSGLWMLTISTISIIMNNMTIDVALGIIIIGVAVANVCLPVDINKTISNIRGNNDEQKNNLRDN